MTSYRYKYIHIHICIVMNFQGVMQGLYHQQSGKSWRVGFEIGMRVVDFWRLCELWQGGTGARRERGLRAEGVAKFTSGFPHVNSTSEQSFMGVLPFQDLVSVVMPS